MKIKRSILILLSPVILITGCNKVTGSSGISSIIPSSSESSSEETAQNTESVYSAGTDTESVFENKASSYISHSGASSSASSSPQIKKKLLSVQNEAYDWFGVCCGGAVTVGKNSKYGVINTNGKIIVPIEYDSIRGAMAPEGYTIAWKNSGSVFGKTAYIFDATGKKLWETSELDVMTCYQNTLIACSETEYDSYGSRLGCELYLMTPEGKQIAVYNDIDDFSQASENCIVLHEYHGSWFVVDLNGKIVTKKTIIWDDVDPPALNRTVLVSSGLKNGYFSKRTVTDKSAIISKDFSEVYSFFGSIADSAGTLFTAYGDYFYDPEADGGKYYLFDAAKIKTGNLKTNYLYASQSLTPKGYDSILLNTDQPYFLVSSDGKWGFLSRDGKTEKLYDDAGRFSDGNAIVLDNKKAYIIDSDFRRISQEITGYDSVATLGEDTYALYKNGKKYLAVYK